MYVRACLIVVLALVGAGSVQAQESEAKALTERLQGYDSYQADFRQTVTDNQGRQVQESSGELRAKRNGLFYWRVAPPMAQFIAANGEEVQVYDPDLEQVTIYPMDDKLTATPALLLSGNVEGLAEAYEVSRVKVGEGRTGYRLEPKDPDSLFVSLTLVFEDRVLKEMRLKDSLEQSSVLEFSNVRINETIADDKFQLDYPESADVIRNRAAS